MDRCRHQEYRFHKGSGTPPRAQTTNKAKGPIESVPTAATGLKQYHGLKQGKKSRQGSGQNLINKTQRPSTSTEQDITNKKQRPSTSTEQNMINKKQRPSTSIEQHVINKKQSLSLGAPEEMS